MNRNDAENEAGSDAAEAARRAGGIAVAFSAGDAIYRPGDPARGWIVLESGRVKVSLTADTGREVTLYRIEAGESCILTTSALLSGETLFAEATAETDVRARLSAARRSPTTPGASPISSPSCRTSCSTPCRSGSRGR